VIGGTTCDHPIADREVSTVNHSERPQSSTRVPASRDAGWSRRDLVLVALLAAAVAAGATWRLTAGSLVQDEASTWAISGHGFGDLVRALVRSEGDAGALYLAVTYLWLHLWGSSEAALRGLSVVCAVGTVPVFFAVARRLLDGASALVATGLFALSPFLLEYSRDARMYSFALLLSVIATYCFVRFVDGRQHFWSWMYVLAASAAVWAHAFCILVVLAHLLSAGCLPRRTVDRVQTAGAFGMVFLLTSPLFLYTVLSGGRGVAWIRPLSLGEVKDLAANLTGSSAGVAPIIVLFVTLAALLLVATAVRRSGRSQELWVTALPVLLLLVPVATTTVVSAFRPFFVTRYLFIALPGYVLVLGASFQWLRRRARALALAGAAALLVIAVPTVDQIWGRATHQENWRAAETFVAARYRPGDEIVIPMAHVYAFGYYATRDPRLASTHPTWAFPYGRWDVAYAPPHRRHLWMRGPIPTRTGHTVWVVLRRPNPAAGLRSSWRSPRLDALRHALHQHPERDRIANFRGVVVYGYRAP
jgi:hypothetical protein